MNIVVVGSGRVGAELAHRLQQKGHKVTIADRSGQSFGNLHQDFRGRTVEGDVLSEDVLHRCGIDQADGLAAVTTSDSLNAVIGHIARAVYRVPRVVVRNYDPRRRGLIEAFELQLVGSSSWGAQRIEELLAADPIKNVFSAGNGEVSLYEVIVPAGAHGVKAAELTREGECILAALTRSGRARLPLPDTTVEDGDVLHICATPEGFEKALQRLRMAKE